MIAFKKPLQEKGVPIIKHGVNEPRLNRTSVTNNILTRKFGNLVVIHWSSPEGGGKKTISLVVDFDYVVVGKELQSEGDWLHSYARR